jgi:hypothetical protein
LRLGQLLGQVAGVADEDEAGPVVRVGVRAVWIDSGRLSVQLAALAALLLCVQAAGLFGGDVAEPLLGLVQDQRLTQRAI